MLDAYLKLIDIPHARPPSLPFLVELQRQHIQSLGWDTLDLFLERPISLEPETIVRKFQAEHRGGLCYELNGAFCHVLQHLGFDAYLASAHVYGHNESVLCFSIDTHAIIVVSMGGTRYLVDVGWGDSYRQPVPIQEGAHFSDRSGEYCLRFQTQAGKWLMEKFLSGAWRAQYAFSMDPKTWGDFKENLNALYVYPDLVSYRRIHAVLPAHDGYVSIKDDTFTVMKDGTMTSARVCGASDVAAVLKQQFNMANAFVDLCLHKARLTVDTALP